jgi:AcrR family transcriptional regulator
MDDAAMSRESARRDILLQKAFELFVKEGYAATRMEDIARAIGLSKPMVYELFTSKEELFHAVVDYMATPLSADDQALMQDYEGPAHALFDIAKSQMKRILRDERQSAVFQLLLSERRHYPNFASIFLAQIWDHGLRPWVDAVTRAMERGEVRQVNRVMLAQLCIMPVLSAQTQRALFGVEMLDGAHLDRYIDEAYDALALSLLTPKADG